jgi:hypothetical protein
MHVVGYVSTFSVSSSLLLYHHLRVTINDGIMRLTRQANIAFIHYHVWLTIWCYYMAASLIRWQPHNHVCRAYTIMLLLLLINHPLTASVGCDPGLIWSRFGLFWVSHKERPKQVLGCIMNVIRYVLKYVIRML